MENKGLAKFFLLMAIVLAFTYLLSNFIGLARTGFEDTSVLNIQTFYLVGGIFALAIICLKLYQVYFVKGDEKYGNSVGFADNGEKPHLRVFKRFTLPQIALLSLIILISLALVNVVFVAKGNTAQISYTGVGFLTAQQFTATDNIIYNDVLIPGAENLGAALLFAIIIVGLGILAKRMNWNPRDYMIYLIVLSVILFALFGMGNHLIHYGDSDVSIIKVGFFWGMGGLLTALTGTFLIFWEMHTVNNFIFDVFKLFSSDYTVYYFIAGIIALVILYVLIYKKRLFGRKPNAAE